MIRSERCAVFALILCALSFVAGCTDKTIPATSGQAPESDSQSPVSVSQDDLFATKPPPSPDPSKVDTEVPKPVENPPSPSPVEPKVDKEVPPIVPVPPDDPWALAAKDQPAAPNSFAEVTVPPTPTIEPPAPVSSDLHSVPETPSEQETPPLVSPVPPSLVSPAPEHSPEASAIPVPSVAESPATPETTETPTPAPLVPTLEPVTPAIPEPSVVEPSIPAPPVPEPVAEHSPEPPVVEPFVSTLPAPEPTLETSSVPPVPEPETSEPSPAVPVSSTNPLRQEENGVVQVDATSSDPSTAPPVVKETTVPETPEKSEPRVEPVAVSSGTVPATAKSSDPLAELFVDWPKPKLLLVFTGFMNGYVEPCGCAGMDQMKGGLSRRHSFFKALEKKGWPTLPIDAGNLNKGFGNQEELKFGIVIDNAYRMMNYGAVGIGNRELLFPTDVLILYAVDSPGAKQRYTSANVAILQFNPEFTAPYRIFEEGGVKVGVVSVIGSSLLKDVNNQDIVHEDAVKRLKALLPQFAEEKCDKRVLLVHGSTAEIEKIVKAVPGQFDFVVPGDTPAEPPFRPRWIGDSLIVEVGEKGKFAVALGIYDDLDNNPFRYERIPLDGRFENSKPVVELMRLYQEQLEKTGLAGLGIKPIPDRRAAELGKFVGSKVCADCHEPSYTVWKKSRHASAWRSLVETSKPARTHDPECIACHVVGWNPTEFLPYENGFMGEKETPLLLDVGCESCHGPGETHVRAEQGSDTALQEKLRKAIRLPLEGNVARKNCFTCHDGDNSPHFDFETYWPKIVHTESEE